MEISFTYENKIDYYNINWNGSVRNFVARSDEIPMTEVEDSSEDGGAEFKCPYSILDDRDYLIIVIESSTSAEDNLPEAYVYFIHKETSQVTFTFYPSYYQCKTCHHFTTTRIL